MASAVTVNFPTANEVLRSVETIDDLRALSVESFEGGENVIVEARGEAGSGGIYVWQAASLAADNSPYVIRPTSVAALEAGRWVWLNEAQSANVRAFGAVMDGVTDDYDAFAAALDSLDNRGGTLIIPAGLYYVSETVHVTKPVRILGEGTGQNPGELNGVNFARKDWYHGTRLMFPAGTCGFHFHTHTTETDIATVNADPESYWNEYSATGSVMRDLVILFVGLSGTPPAYVAGADGIRQNCKLLLENIWIVGASGHGHCVSAGSRLDYPSDFGNANQSSFRNMKAIRAGGVGFYNEGGDANSMHYDNCDATSCGSWAFSDNSFLGNKYTVCHTQGCNATGLASATAAVGSFQCTSINAACKYDNCYIEAGGTTGMTAHLEQSCIVVGGIATNPAYFRSTEKALVLGPSGAYRGNFSATNDLGTYQVRGGFGRNPQATAHVAVYWGTSEVSATMDANRIQYDGTNKLWQLAYAGSSIILDYINEKNLTRAALANGYCLGVPNGLAMGSAATAPRLLPAAASAPASGSYIVGDTVFRLTPASGQPMGWRCSVAGSPGTWIPMPNMP